MTTTQESVQGRSSAPAASGRTRTLTPNVRLGFAYICIAVLGYAVLPVWTNLLLDSGMLPFDIAVWRFIIAAPVFWGASFLLLRREPHSIGRQRPLPRAPLMLLGSLYAISAVTAFFGLDMIPAGTFSVIFYTYPAMVAGIGLMLGERLSGWGWLAVALTIVGIALTVPDFSEGLSGGNFIGVGLALINALVVAIYFVLSGRLLAGRVTGLGTMARAVAWTMLGTLIFILIAGLFVGMHVPNGLNQIVYLLGLSLISTVMSLFCLNMGIQLAGATRAAVFGTFEPLLTAVMALIFLGQQMRAVQWVGGIIVVSSMILLQTRGSRRDGGRKAIQKP